MKLIDMRSVTITEKGQIALPKSLRTMKGFKIGNKIALLAFEDRIELRPMSQLNENMMFARASEKTLSKEWNKKKEDTAWKNL